MKLVLKVEGASEAELARGLKAAMAYFEQHGVDPLAASCGMAAIRAFDDMNFGEEWRPSEEQSRNATVWVDARGVALEACCEGWTKKPETWGLFIEFTPEEERRFGLAA